MTHVRKTADFRTVSIHSWNDLVQEESDGLEARGELQNLPDQGKPIKIWRTELDPDKDLAFSRLKNAGVLPVWMELDKEIVARTEALWAKLGWIEQAIRSDLELLTLAVQHSPDPSRSMWQRLTSWFRMDLSDDVPQLPTLTSIKAFQVRERSRFLELAADLDKKISAYHDSLPRGAENLQRLRWIPSRAERIFNERITVSAWWDEVHAERA